MPRDHQGEHRTYFQQAIGFMLGDEGADLNRPVPRSVGEKHINDLLGRHPFHPYDPSIDDSIDLSALASSNAPQSAVPEADDHDGATQLTTPLALAEMDKKFIDHAWACLRKQEAGGGDSSSPPEADEVRHTAGAGSYLNLPYLTHPQDHPCYTQNKLFGNCMRDTDKSEMQLFMRHVNCFHPFKVDLMKCITKHTRTDRLNRQHAATASSPSSSSSEPPAAAPSSSSQ
jgi:hypothetical protein